jgi:hypothetical protein
MILPLKQNPPRCKINNKTSIKVKRERFYFSGDFFKRTKIENATKNVTQRRRAPYRGSV